MEMQCELQRPATYIALNILVKGKETDETNFADLFYLTQSIILSACDQYKIIPEILPIFSF